LIYFFGALALGHPKRQLLLGFGAVWLGSQDLSYLAALSIVLRVVFWPFDFRL